MKLILKISLCILLPWSMHAQADRTEVVEYNGLKYPAYIRDVDAAPEIVEKAIADRFAFLGQKPRSHRGYNIYRNVMLPNTGMAEPVDVHIKVERRGRKNDNLSTIVAIVTRPGTITEAKPSKDQRAIGSGVSLAPGGTAFLMGLTPDIENRVYLKELADQEDLVKRSEKKLKDMESDQQKLQKQLEKLAGDIETQRKELEAARAALQAKRAAAPGSTPN